ncbi:MAG TPA: glycosyltransferase family 2 protein [Candidatus Saccharimonadales bacterium]|nr:glycosyltransferase family 2 protein [Candidatus Saccharimonadales bacterium]
MSDQRISIIIPAYNEERYLAQCLDSIAAQTLKPYEVLVVDNNSTDKTSNIARKYPFVTLLHEPKQSRAIAQRTGFDAAKGTVLARIDADAIVPPDWTGQIVGYFARASALQTAWSGGALFYNVRFPRLVSALYDWVEFPVNRLITGHPSLWGSNMALPKRLWAEVRTEVCTESNLHEDLDLSIHLHDHGHKIVYDRRVKVGVELRPARSSPAEVWEYLKMWPRTLAKHDVPTWPLCWLVCLPVFVGMPFFTITERIARLFGRAPLES